MRYVILLIAILCLTGSSYVLCKETLIGDEGGLSQQIVDSYYQHLADAPGPVENGKARNTYRAKLFALAFEKITASHADALSRITQEVLAEPDRPLDGWMVSQLVLALVSNDDRETLLRLLSSRCPERIYYRTPTELVVSNTHGHPRHCDFLVLCDAYDQSTSAANQKVLSDLLRRAMGNDIDQRLEGKPFVNACRDWYGINKAIYTINIEYYQVLSRNYWGEEDAIPKMFQPTTEVLPTDLRPNCE